VANAVIKIDYVSDWLSRIKGRLYTEFRNKTTWNGWATLIARQLQDLEDAYQTLLTLLDIDNSSGVQLDLVGRIVGQQRLGSDDATYRLYLRARIAANNSSGDPDSIYAVFTALLGAIGFKATTDPLGVKILTVKVTGVITRAQSYVAAYFLGVAKEAGVRGLLEWQESASAALFTYDGTTAQGYDAGVYAGATQAA